MWERIRDRLLSPWPPDRATDGAGSGGVASRPSRRLAAVWFADIVGYSELVSRDETRGLQVVRAFQKVAREQVEAHGGRVVKFIGDAAFAEFPSVDAAARSARGLLQAFTPEQGDSGGLRIGIHVGDVVSEPDGDLFGDGVNTAARLQAAAEPGEVLVSESAWRHLRQQDDFTFEARGEKELKGLAAPERVWSLTHARTGPEAGSRSWLRHEGGLSSGLMGVAVAYVASAWILLQVVDTLNSLVGLPETLVRGALVLLLMGFPVVMATAWVQLQGRSASGGLLGVAGILTWRNAAVGGVAALALWGLGAAIWAGGRGVGTGPSSVAGVPIRVLAVLPFDNMLPDPEEQAWLVEGLHEQVIHEIQRLQVPGLRVISRTSVLPYADTELDVPEIAARLNADAVLEGSVRSDGRRLRATMQLIDGTTDHHEWSHEYDASLEESFLEAQTQVALRVARMFSGTPDAELAGSSKDVVTEHPDALRAYLRGRYLFKESGAPSAVQASELFRRAVEIDPDFALAWASLAEAWLASAHFGVPPHTAFPRADSAAIQAITRDPGLAEARIVLADARFHYDWNWADAEREFREGIRLNPSHSTGHWWFAGLLAARSRTEQAVEQIDIARTLDPMAPIVDAFGGRVLYWGRRYDPAESMARQALELSPDNFYALGVLGFIHLARDEVETAVDVFRQSTAISPKFLPGLAMALARSGRIEEARGIADRLEARAEERYVAPYERAFAHVGLGDHDRALTLLEEATETRDAELIWIAVDPALDPIRDEPRFQAILDEMGLSGAGTPVALSP